MNGNSQTINKAELWSWVIPVDFSFLMQDTHTMWTTKTLSAHLSDILPVGVGHYLCPLVLECEGFFAVTLFWESCPMAECVIIAISGQSGPSRGPQGRRGATVRLTNRAVNLRSGYSSKIQWAEWFFYSYFFEMRMKGPNIGTEWCVPLIWEVIIWLSWDASSCCGVLAYLFLKLI